MHDFSFDQPRQIAEVVIDAHVHYGKACSRVARKGVDGASALKEVAGLDVGDVRGCQAEAVVGNVVVRGEQDYGFVLQARRGIAGHGGNTDGHGFQFPQGKGRLGQNFLMFQGRFCGLFVQRGDMQFVHDGQRRGMKRRRRVNASVPVAAVVHMSRMARARSLAEALVLPVPIQG